MPQNKKTSWNYSKNTKTVLQNKKEMNEKFLETILKIPTGLGQNEYIFLGRKICCEIWILELKNLLALNLKK
jgi:hypothetical protein